MANSEPDIHKTFDKQRRILAYLPSTMAPRLRFLRLSGRVNFVDEILETLIAKSEARSQRAERIYDLVKDLRNILDLAEKEVSDLSAGKGASKLTQVLREIQRENEWGQCESTVQYWYYQR